MPMDWPTAMVASVTIVMVGVVIATATWQVLEIGKQDARGERHLGRFDL
jgi:hypothetical protein